MQEFTNSTNKVVNDFAEKARLFRKERLNLEEHQKIDFEKILSDLKVFSVFTPVSKPSGQEKDDLSGIAQIRRINGEDLKFMLVNTATNLGKQNFTIGHELYHLFIQEDFSSSFCKTGTFQAKDSEEYNADVFSANLLMPATVVRERFQELKAVESDREAILFELEAYFQCSRAALIWRLQDLSLIQKFEYHSFTNLIRTTVKRYPKADFRLYFPTNVSKVISNADLLLFDLLNDNKISFGKYYKNLSDLSSRKFIDGWQ